MKVIYSEVKSQITIDSLTNGKIYDVLEVFSFGNRFPEYKILNDKGTKIWIDSSNFEMLQKKKRVNN